MTSLIATAPKPIMELIDEMAGERAWNDSTLQHYRACVRHMELWKGGTIYAHEFDKEWVNQYLTEIVEGGKWSLATVRTRRVALLAIWHAAYQAELIDVAPRKLRRVPQHFSAPVAWSYDEMNRLVATAAAIKGRGEILNKSGDFLFAMSTALFWRVFIRVMWDTGLRTGDALALKTGQLQPDNTFVLTQHKVRTWHVCKLHQSTVDLVRRMRLEPDWPLIPWTKSHEMLRRDFLRKIVLPTGLTGTAKQIRKSSASDVEMNHPGQGGIHLGHRMGANIAHNHYLDPRIVAKSRPMPTELTGDSDGPIDGPQLLAECEVSL